MFLKKINIKDSQIIGTLHFESTAEGNREPLKCFDEGNNAGFAFSIDELGRDVKCPFFLLDYDLSNLLFYFVSLALT